MKVCFFGTYESNDLTLRLKNLLQEKDVQVIECQQDVHSFSQLVKAYPKLVKKHFSLDYDVMIVPWRGIMSLPLAKLLTRRPIVYFPYVSIYDTLINDRKIFKKNSIQAKFVWLADKIGCKLADVIVLENDETINYFCTEYNLKKSKFRKFIWGADEKKFPCLPIKKTDNTLSVFYLGTFIPFHGVEVIIEAAKILADKNDITFTFCGDGQTKKENENLCKKYGLKNVRFLGFVDFSIVRENLENADICLGTFGSLDHRPNSPTNKIFQMLTSQKPLITRDVPVMKEIKLKSNQNCILVKPGDPHDLAKAILFLKNNPETKNKIAKEGYSTFKKVTTESWNNFWEKTLLPLFSKN